LRFFRTLFARDNCGDAIWGLDDDAAALILVAVKD
jgi:hypothetical protein